MTGSILLVEDEPIVLTTLAKALAARGHAVETAASGTEAMERLQRRRFDAVLTDLVMAGADGIEVLREAKRADPDACVLLMSGYCDSGSAIAALRLGADDYLTKPFDYEELFLRVGRCMERRELCRKVRLYERFLPVCAGCRRVRDDTGVEPGAGAWVSLEEYLLNRSGVTVSHGCCPECAKTL